MPRFWSWLHCKHQLLFTYSISIAVHTSNTSTAVYFGIVALGRAVLGGVKMDPEKLIRHMCEKSGQSLRSVSLKMGKSPTYLSSLVTRGSSPTIATLIEIAGACGYVLQVDGQGEILTIENVSDSKPS